MKAINERLQQLQEEQAQREKDLQNGKIRIERPESSPAAGQAKAQKASTA
jgi:hypothetical protein